MNKSIGSLSDTLYKKRYYFFFDTLLCSCQGTLRCYPHIEDDSTTAAGFPHSEICGSKVTCTSPQLIAAYRVLLRLTWPRHPPYALTYLTFFWYFRTHLLCLSFFGSLSLTLFIKRGFTYSILFYAVVKVRENKIWWRRGELNS